MNIQSLKIGDLIAKIPIIQGGMGVGVSLSNLAGAVASCGGIGVISAAHPGYKEDDFKTNTLQANLRALKNHILKAKEISNNGIIGVNIMVAMKHYEDFVKTSIKSGADIIISGAGLPIDLPKYVGESKVKLAPIVSSLKATKIIFKYWTKHYNKTPDMIIIEGPLAGGHLGFNKEKLSEETSNFESTVTDIINEVKTYEETYSKSIPVIVAGGVYTGIDIANYLNLGACGVQMGTRFVATYECDASDEFKNSYIASKESDIKIVKSPVGMPGRAIVNDFINRVEQSGDKISHCYNCLIPCNPKDTPYCISKALINSASGDINNGLLFCGQNAYKIDKLVSVEDLINELVEEISNF